MNLDLLNKKINDSGLTITFIANTLGISRQQLYKKLSGESEFKVSELNEVFDILKLNRNEKEEIFLSENVN
ncbi:toxin-antitoxin system, antitoxin component, Xre family protein [Peptoniphilus asaccharolyticus]